MRSLRLTVLSAATLILITRAQLFAADVTIGFGFNDSSSLQTAAGGAETIIYQSDTTSLSSTSLSDGVLSSPEQPSSLSETSPASAAVVKQEESAVASIGASSFFSPYMKVYSLPLSYRFSSDFKVNTSIPYIQRTIKRDDVEFKADGLGDISLGMEYRWYNSTKFQASTSVDLILPTGDTEAIGKNNGQQLTVPLGSGSLSTYLVQHGTWWINNDLKLFGNIGIRYATPAEYTAYPSVMQTSNATGQNIREEKGMVYTGMIGSEYRLTKDVAVAGRFSIIAVQEGKKSIDHADYVDSNDALLAGDASVTIKYRVHKNTSIGLTGIIPAFTRYDKDVEDPEKRTWGVNFSISTFF